MKKKVSRTWNSSVIVDDSFLSPNTSHRSTEILFNMDFCWEFMVFLFAPLENSRQLHLSNKQTETETETGQKKILLGCLNNWRRSCSISMSEGRFFFLSFSLNETVFFSSLSLLSSLCPPPIYHEFYSIHLIWVPDKRNMRKDTHDSHKHTQKRFYGL